MQTHGHVNIINNAGVALGATVRDISYQDFEWVMNINFWGVVYGTKAFLPYIKTTSEGAIVNVSSIFGTMAMPTQSAYNASKFAVRGFTESLRQEMAVENLNIGVTCVIPSGIKTNIAHNARLTERKGIIESQSALDFAEQSFYTTSDKAAKKIVNAIQKNRRRVLIGPDAIVLDLLRRLIPTKYQKIWEIATRYRAKQMGGIANA